MANDPKNGGPDHDLHDEAYFDHERRKAPRVFDSDLLRKPCAVLPVRKPIVLAPDATVTQAVNAMQHEKRGCVLVTDDGSHQSELVGIFTERDVLFKVVGRGKNPATLEIGKMMTPDPEYLVDDCSVAWVLNKMSLGGFRHVPIVDNAGRPKWVVSIRDVVDFLVEHFPHEVRNLPPEFALGRGREREGA